jgi:hypothetical protein
MVSARTTLRRLPSASEAAAGRGMPRPTPWELATVVARVIVASIGTRRRTVSDRMLPTRLPDALRMLRPLRRVAGHDGRNTANPTVRSKVVN